VRNPALAETLRAFGREGADYFYQGPVADEIVRAAAAIGGVITADDLRGYRVAERTPLSAERFGHRWVTAPPESAGGYTLLASLALLERWAPQGEADVVHALGESFRGPFLDRARYFGDPDFVRVPVDALLAPDRIAARAARFDRAHARPSADYDLPLPDAPAPVAVPPGAGTSHLCVVDAEGNVASVTTTVNIPFGAGVSVRGLLAQRRDGRLLLAPRRRRHRPRREHHKPRGRAATSGVDHDPEHRAAGRPPRALRGRKRRYAHRDRGDPGRLPRGGAARARG
jgi:gamma-glutamyltranspeptidase/glutathione hydrolase